MEGGKQGKEEGGKEGQEEGGKKGRGSGRGGEESSISSHNHLTSADFMREREHRQKWEAAVVEWRDLMCKTALDKFK